MAIENWLLCNRLRAVAARVAAATDDAERDAAWAQAERDVEAAEAGEDADIALPILERSLEELQALLRGWDAGTAHLPEWDRAVLKRGLKAYRKRLRLMRLDDESSASRNPLSKGDESSILGVRPPEQYPDEVWAMLIAQGKLRDAGDGLLELATA
jgi:hypothetical protein